MASIAYITDGNMIEFHRLNGNRTMNFWRPSNSKKFTDFVPGDLLFFLSKGSERGRFREKGIVGYGRFQKAHTLTFRQMWNVYGTENGYATEEELHDAIVKVSKNKKMPRQMNCLYLKDVVFFQTPIYLSEIGVQLSNKVESYIYLDKEDPQATSKVLNKARETGMDIWMAAMSNTPDHQKALEEEQIKHQLAQAMQKAEDSFYTESEKKRLRRISRQMIEKKAEEKKIFELIKGSRTDLYCYTGDRIEIIVPFLYNSKDFSRKLQYLIGHCLMLQSEFRRWSDYHIPVIFEAAAEEELPKEVLDLLKSLNQR